MKPANLKKPAVLYLLSGLFLCALLWQGCSSGKQEVKPNVILIMADDMGYECLSSYGSLSYSTPRLDKLASEGVRFEYCMAQPLCTPSRVKIMTGMYNYRNYEYFGYLGLDNPSIGTLMKESGYATCIAGKWQLNGLRYKKEISDWNDLSRPVQLGFDEYCLWQLTKERKDGERYANALIECDGQTLERDEESYGPDLFAEKVLDFIDRHSEEPFFIYYPMVLVHDPFVATPDSPRWSEPEERFRNDTAYFRDMVSYTDKIVGRIVDRLEERGCLENTVLIFTADNGTHNSIYTHTTSARIRGGKGNTTDAGTRVPLIVHYPEGGQKGVVYPDLIEFSDFYPTLAEIALGSLPQTVSEEETWDGQSFYPVLTGAEHSPRNTAFVHYDPRWGKNVNRYRNQFVRTVDYKLYADGSFYHVTGDVLEKKKLPLDSLNEAENKVYQMLREELEKHPKFQFE